MLLFDANKPENWHNDYCSCCKSTDTMLLGCKGADCYVSVCSVCVGQWGVFLEDRSSEYVCPACVNGTAPFKDKFMVNKKNTDENKIKIREDFTKDISGQVSKVLMLDCGEATQHLKKKAPKLEIHVPNPDPVICKRLKKAKAKAYQMRLSHMLTLNKVQFDAAWLDYCGTYDGSNVQGCYPREDLRKMWERCLNRQKKTVHLAVTFCKRGCHAGMKNMISEQKQTAKMWGWKAVPTKQVEYGKGMYYVMFKATKI